MTVNDCVKLAAVELGISEALESGEAAEKILSLLVKCYNIVENELALDYLPLTAEDEVETATGTVEFSVLKENAVRICKVADESGEAVKFKLFPTYLKTQPGKLKIWYTYTPQEKVADDKCECALGVSARMIAYGVAAEYCLCMSLYEESAVWDKKYKGAIEAVYKATPSKRIQSRRWL